jgi:hypothetical protein
MNMKVHQTLVSLNLLSFGTKDLAAPTIGIQSAANHYTFCAAHIGMDGMRIEKEPRQ